jgi:hypothetical protein
VSTWARAAQRVLRRFTDLGPGTNSPGQLWGPDADDGALPVVLLGTDYIDDERALFTAGLDAPGAVGQAPYGAIAAIDGDVLIEMASVSAAGAGLAWSVELLPATALPLAAQAVAVPPAFQRSGDSPNRAGLDLGTSAAVGVPFVKVQQDDTLRVLPPFILQAGRGLLVRAAALNVAARILFAWRNS